MKKIAVSSLVSLFILSCSVPAPNNFSTLNGRMQNAPTGHSLPVKENFTELAKKYNFAELEKEYKSFSTKALSHVYVKRMFGKYLGGIANSIQLKRQLEFSRYLKTKGDTSYETSLKNMFIETPALFTQLTDNTSISAKMTDESATFGTFVNELSPYPRTPVAIAATNIGTSSFTANWNAVSGTTSYKLYIDDLLEYTGTNLTYSKTGLARGTSHSYYVKATNGAGDSVSSNIISLSTLGFETLTNFQSIATVGGIDWEYFTIGTEHYLAIANYFTGSSRNTDSKIYKWNSSTSQFDSIQSIATNGVWNWKSFKIGTDTYLAAANSYNDASGNINSKIYKWNISTSQFDSIQLIATNTANDLEYFTIGTEHYLAVANNSNDSSVNIDSKIYKWNSSTSQFVEYQSIATNSAVDFESFTIGTEHYLAVANYYDSSYNMNSKIYKWNSSTSQFVEYQSIITNGALDFESFTIGTEHYLAIANFSNEASFNTDSKIYKWNTNTSQFDEYQSIATNGAVDWKFFTIGTEHYLAVANAYNGTSYNIDSKIYKWNSSTNQFNTIPIQLIPTNGARDWKFFTIEANNYLAVANYSNGASNNIDSKIYRLD